MFLEETQVGSIIPGDHGKARLNKLFIAQLWCSSSGIVTVLVSWGWTFSEYKQLFDSLFLQTYGVIVPLIVSTTVALAALALNGSGYVRVCWWLLRLCSILCVFATALFIALTGGAHSPFVAFYVMTFTLTLSYSKQPSAPILLLLFFGITSFFAFLLGQPRIPNSGNASIEQLLTTGGYYWAVAFGCFASILIASISRFNELRTWKWIWSWLLWPVRAVCRKGMSDLDNSDDVPVYDQT